VWGDFGSLFYQGEDNGANVEEKVLLNHQAILIILDIDKSTSYQNYRHIFCSNL